MPDKLCHAVCHIDTLQVSPLRSFTVVIKVRPLSLSLYRWGGAAYFTVNYNWFLLLTESIFDSFKNR
jgi:hypothetical protein